MSNGDFAGVGGGTGTATSLGWPTLGMPEPGHADDGRWMDVGFTQNKAKKLGKVHANLDATVEMTVTNKLTQGNVKEGRVREGCKVHLNTFESRMFCTAS